MKFSAADITILRIRCPDCGQHSEKLVTVLMRKALILCNVCGSYIDLKTPVNRLLIKETADNCARIGAALLSQASEQLGPGRTPDILRTSPIGEVLARRDVIATLEKGKSSNSLFADKR